MNIKITKVREVITPNRGTPQSAGIDFYIPKFDKIFVDDFFEKNPTLPLKRNEILIYPNERVLIPSGIKYNIPDGTALIAMNKSGVASKKGLVTGACVGDSDYQGEFHINLLNVSSNTVAIYEHEKILQCLLMPVLIGNIVEYNSVTELYKNKESLRGECGFGSTGV